MAASEQSFVVVSDSVGFVGAFASVAEAQARLRPYIGVPFVYYEWPRKKAPPAEAAGDGGETVANEKEDLIWVLPYKNNAVACASNVKSVVETVQRELLRLDLVHDDDVKYWEAVVGNITSPAQLRLDDLVAAMTAAPSAPGSEKKDEDTVSKFLDFASRHDKGEPARINLLESVVPRALDSAPQYVDSAGVAPPAEGKDTTTGDSADNS
jgi:hypothetical protein